VNQTRKRNLLAIFSVFLASAAIASAQTGLGEAAADAVDSSITTVSPILGIILGFSVLVGLLFAFCKKK